MTPASATSSDASKIGGRRIASDVVVQVVGRLGNLALGIVVTIVVVRSLGDVAFGEWSALVAVLGLSGALADLGFTRVTVRRATEEPDAEPAWLGALLQLRAIMGTVIFVGSIAVIVAISSSNAMLVAGVVLCVNGLIAIPSALEAVFQLRVRNDLMMLVITVQSVIWLAAASIVTWHSGGLVALSFAFLIAGIVSNAVLVVLALRHARVSAEGARERWGALVRVGVPVAIGSVLILGYARLDQILVLVLAGPGEAGLYGSVYRIFDQAQFVAVSVSTTVFALLAASFASDTPRFKRLLQSMTEVLIAVSLGGLGFTLVYSHELIVLLFGDEFAPAARALPILMATLPLVSLGYVVGNLVLLTDRQRTFVFIAAAGLGFNLAANLATVPRWGFIAAAWVTLATEVVVLAPAWLAVRGRLPAHLGVGRFPAIIASTVVVTGLLVLLHAFDTPVLVAIVVTILTFPLALMISGAVSMEELRSLKADASVGGAASRESG